MPVLHLVSNVKVSINPREAQKGQQPTTFTNPINGSTATGSKRSFSTFSSKDTPSQGQCNNLVTFLTEEQKICNTIQAIQSDDKKNPPLNSTAKLNEQIGLLNKSIFNCEAIHKRLTTDRNNRTSLNFLRAEETRTVSPFKARSYFERHIKKFVKKYRVSLDEIKTMTDQLGNENIFAVVISDLAKFIHTSKALLRKLNNEKPV